MKERERIGRVLSHDHVQWCDERAKLLEGKSLEWEHVLVQFNEDCVQTAKKALELCNGKLLVSTVELLDKLQSTEIISGNHKGT